MKLCRVGMILMTVSAVAGRCVAAEEAGSGTSPAKSAQGSLEIVFSADRDGGWDFYRMGVDGSHVTPVTTMRSAAELWGHCSAINHKLVYVEKGSGIHVMGLEVGGKTAHLMKDENNVFIHPACATDESILTLVKNEKTPEGATSGIIMVNPKTFEITPVMKQDGRQIDPVWFHKSKQMLYVHVLDGPKKGSEFWVVPADGTEAVLIAASNYSAMQPDISPDDRLVVFASNRSGPCNLWLMDADGTGLKQLTFGKGNDTEPKWSPDGKSVLFVSDQDGHRHLYVVSADGNDVKQLTQGAFDCAGPNWHMRPPKTDESASSPKGAEPDSGAAVNPNVSEGKAQNQ